MHDDAVDVIMVVLMLVQHQPGLLPDAFKHAASPCCMFQLPC